MAIKWGSIVANGTSQMRVGYDVSHTPTTTTSSTSSCTVTLKIYVWTKYGISDSSNSLVVSGDITSSGSSTISTSVSSGAGWSTSNQKLLRTVTKTITLSRSSTKTVSFSIKLSGIDKIGITASVSGSDVLPRQKYSTPEQPTVKTVLNADNTITVSASASSTTAAPVSTYRVEYKIDDGSWLLWGNSSTKSRTTSTTHPPYVWYFRVRTENTDASSLYTTTSAVYTRPNKPASVSVAQSVGSNKLSYNGLFSTVSSASIYHSNNGGSFTLIASGASRSSYTHNNPPAGVNTYYVVFVGPTGLRSVNSNTVSATTYIYTVSNGYGGTISTRLLPPQSSVTAPANPTRTGYDFVGWVTQQGGNTAVSFPLTITSNKTIYAKWQQRYTFTLHNGYSGVISMKTVSSGTSIAKPANPTRADYDFLGWGTAQNGSVNVTFPITISANRTVYAQWQIKDTSIEFISDTHVESGVTPYIAPDAESLSDKVFAGWSYTNGSSVVDYKPGASVPTVAGKNTLYAVYIPNSSVFDVNNGVISVKSQYRGVNFPSTSAIIPGTISGNAVSKVGAGFNNTPIKSLVFESPLTGIVDGAFNGTGVGDFSVKLNGTGMGVVGTISRITNRVNTISIQCVITLKDGETTVSTLTAQSGEPIGTLVSPPRSPVNVFNGYIDASGKKVKLGDIFNYNSNITLTASTLPRVSCTVTFAPNGGSGSTPSKSDTNAIVVPESSFTRGEHVFSHWVTSTGAQYKPGDTLLLENNNVVLYAQWLHYDDVFDFNIINNGLYIKLRDGVQLPSVSVQEAYNYNGSVLNIVGTQDGAFAGSGIVSIILPKTVEHIGKNSFSSCQGLISIVCNNVTSVGENAFENCTSITSLSLPKLKNIPDFCFNGALSLVSVGLPRLKSIGAGAFRNTSITGLQVYGDCSIGEDAFKNCNNLIKVQRSIESIPVSGRDKPWGGNNVQLDWNLPTFEIEWRSFGAYPQLQTTRQLFGKPIVLPTQPARVGYQFDSWRTEIDSEITELYDVYGDSIYDATFNELEQFTITFDVNGGDIEIPSIQSPYFRADTVPTKTGELFYGWSLVKEGAGLKEYDSDGNQINPNYISVGTLLDSDITVYAQWSNDTFSIDSPPVSVRVNSTCKVELDIFAQSKDGWFIEILDAGELSQGGELKPITVRPIEPQRGTWSTVSTEFTPNYSGGWFGKYAYRRNININSQFAVPEGSVLFVKDIDKDLLGAADDFRVVFFDGSKSVEIPHVYNGAGELWFRTKQSLPAGVSPEAMTVNGKFYGAYYIYYGLENAGPAKTGNDLVFDVKHVNREIDIELPHSFGAGESTISFDYTPNETYEQLESSPLGRKQYLIDTSSVSIYLYERRLYIMHHDIIKNGAVVDISSVFEKDVKTRYVIQWTDKSSNIRDYVVHAAKEGTEYSELRVTDKYYDTQVYDESERY